MSCTGHRYLSRLPERLVVQGYRHMLAGCVGPGEEHWQQARDLYCLGLGADRGELALAALGDFVAALGRCAVCPLRFFPAATQCVCRDECLILGLVSGLQNGDEDGPRHAVGALACARLRSELLASAGDYAMTLKLFGQTLLPVPGNVVAELVFRAAAPATDDLPTYH